MREGALVTLTKREKGLEKQPKSKLPTGYAMPTIEDIRTRIRKNFPQQGASSLKRKLVWNRETAHTLITSCATYRISKMEDPKNKGLFGYALSLAPTATSAAKHLCGPLVTAKDCREAAQRHVDGEPLQADLA